MHRAAPLVQSFSFALCLDTLSDGHAGDVICRLYLDLRKANSWTPELPVVLTSNQVRRLSPIEYFTREEQAVAVANRYCDSC